MTTNTQIIHSVRYRLSQAVTKLAQIYPDPRNLKKALSGMIDYEIKAIARESGLELEDE